ncbi:MAG: alcohol dehydrogenase catalytic domain-containing protein, partial [Gammaproteobacteria bacterium]|nr:alcohol dehydrogenase catalytic domain-containing protein [Gammaproteobacteria bacterium]
MPQRAKAAICREINQPVVVEEIEVESPRRGEVMIRLAACGVCHSDYSVTTGTIPFPPPVVLGHEGAGIVVEVGEGVTDIAVGDAVVSSFVSMCGKCRYCQTGRPQLCDQAAKAAYTLPDGTVRTKDLQGKPLNIFSGCGVMAEVATLHTDNVVKIDRDI